MKTLKVEDVICKDCNLPHTLDAHGVCELCRWRVAPGYPLRWRILHAVLGLLKMGD